MYEYQLEACYNFNTFEIYVYMPDFFMLHFGAMNLLLFLVG